LNAWTIDADDIHIAGDFDATLLHRTPWIEGFLDQSRDDKFIIVGTKGFGKTLLLKAKRIAYQEAGRLCIPQDALLDKPVGDKVFSRSMLQLFGEGLDPWSKLWLTAIGAAVLKQLKMVDDLDVSPRFANLLADTKLRTVLDHFVVLLDFSPKELHRSGSETNAQIVPRLRAINAPVAIFIDSVDEYFNKHIHTPIWRAKDAGELSPNVWFLSQMALVEVAYQLRRITKHLKVFAAVRREAFARLVDFSPMVQQYRGSAIDIVYTEASLRQIFINNIQREKHRNLAAPSSLTSDPIHAFLGRTEVVHGFTGESEDVFEYIKRHTFFRPRDLMTIGQRLASLEPEERKLERKFKTAVHEAATEIAQEYLNEIAPRLNGINLPVLLSLLPSNVLSRATVESLARRYDEECGAEGVSGLEAFGMLFKMGLLGHVQTDPLTGRKVQRFLMPGEGRLDHESKLPPSTHYLVRSVISGLVANLNPDYPGSQDRSNIIDNGRSWKDPEQPAGRQERRAAVLKADIAGFGRLMAEGRDEVVRDALLRAVKEHTATCLYASVQSGDSLAMVHEDASALLKIVIRIQDDIFTAPSHPQLRIAVDFGPVSLEVQNNQRVELGGGAATLRVARMEPLVLPGEIWATEEFAEELANRPTLYGAVEIDGGVNLKKPNSREEDTFIRVFRVGPNLGTQRSRSDAERRAGG
jgi:class 3 adenylate cyclase